jgi:hypothetical protein
MGAQEVGRASSATGYLLSQRRWSVLSLLRDLRRDRRSPPKGGEALTKGAKKTIALLVAMVVLVVSGVAYAVNSFPTRPDAASDVGDHQGIDDMPVVGGLDGLLGDAEDAEEQD